MTREPLDRLRRADPVPQPVGYTAREQAGHVADILDRDGEPSVTVDDTWTDRRTGPRWLVVAVAAAAVLLLAIGSAVFAARHTDSAPVASTGRVTCGVAANGGPTAVGARLAQARQVIGERIHQLGGSVHSFTSGRAEGTIGFTPQGISVGRAEQVCRASSVDIRPVIARPVVVDARASRSSTPLSTLAFAVPATEADHARLSVQQRAELAAAMSRYDCSSLSTATSGLVCDESAVDASRVLLVGSPLVRAPDVVTSEAVPPSQGAAAEWTVALSLDATGAARLKAFTGGHHTGNSAATLAGCGTAGQAACSDFLAITVDGHVESVPVTTAALDSTVSISGAFDQASARKLASDIGAASAQLHAG